MGDGITRRGLLKWAAGSLALGVVGLAGVEYATRIEPDALVVERLSVRLARLPQAFDGLALVQLSDLHHGPLVELAHIQEALDLAMAEKPELIVLTGDMVSQSIKYIEPVVQACRRLQAPLGVYAVLGNHDYYVGYISKILAAFKSVGIRLLRNEAIALKRGKEQISLVGVDDLSIGLSDLARALKTTPPDNFKLMLVHEPDFVDEAARQKIDLQLSGHSHGGQVKLPGVGPLILPKHGRKYPEGLTAVGQRTYVYTSRGIGLLAPAVRFNCPPEVTSLRLETGTA